MNAVGEISREEMERLLRRVDFSKETDLKERLWKRLMERMAAEESSVMDLSDDDLAQAAGGLHTGGTACPPVKKIEFSGRKS